MRKPYYLGGAKSNGTQDAQELVINNIIPKLQMRKIPAKDTPSNVKRIQGVLVSHHMEDLEKIAKIMPDNWGGDDITKNWENDVDDAVDFSVEVYTNQAKKRKGNRKVDRKGGKVDPSLNPSYCDGHISQCQDFFSTCQNGGQIDASINPSFCDTHNSQCKDLYTSCGGGLNDKEIYNQYKKLKKKYKKLTRNKKNFLRCN